MKITTLVITWQENLIRRFPAIASMGLLIDNRHITYINKAINARNISEPKSNHTQVTVRLGIIHHVVMHVVAKYEGRFCLTISNFVQSLATFVLNTSISESEHAFSNGLCGCCPGKWFLFVLEA